MSDALVLSLCEFHSYQDRDLSALPNDYLNEVSVIGPKQPLALQ